MIMLNLGLSVISSGHPNYNILKGCVSLFRADLVSTETQLTKLAWLLKVDFVVSAVEQLFPHWHNNKMA